MTGLELLRQEMAKRGATKAQLESKILSMVLEILSNDDEGLYKSLSEVEDEIRKKRNILSFYEGEIRDKQYQAEEIIKDAKRQWNEIKGYIEEFNEALKNCETPEGRDAMRRAQTYVNSVKIKNGYDNTAFNILLGNILSAGDMGGLNAVRRIDPTLVKNWAVDYSILGEDAPKSDDVFYEPRKAGRRL